MSKNPPALLTSPLEKSPGAPACAAEPTPSEHTEVEAPLPPKVHPEFHDSFVTPKLFVAIVALTHGLCDLAGLAGFMYAKNSLQMNPQTMQMLAGLIALPWCIKPIFGYLVDNLIVKIKTAKYVFFCTASFRIAGYMYLAHFNTTMMTFYFIGFSNSVFYLFENIIAEYILVKSTKQENEENGETNNQLPIYFGYRATGSLIGAFFGGRIVKYYGNSPAFFIAGIMPVFVIFAALIYKERSFENREKRSFRDELRAMGELLGGNKVLQLMIFVSLINMQPNFDSLYTFYYTDYLKFSTEDLANFSTFGTICYILGLVLYSYYFKSIEPKKFYLFTNFLLWIINVSFMLVVYGVVEHWGYSNKMFCLLNQGFYSFVAEINFMPLLAIWCALCPANLEATSITLFTGLINLSSNLSNYLGALFIYLFSLHSESYEKIGKAVIIQNVYLLVLIIAITFVPFPIPNRVKESKPEEKKEEKKVEKNMEEKKMELVD